MKELLYVMGSGRSGTTLLAVVLGAASGLTHCGELNRYPILRSQPPEGATPRSLEFWQRFNESFAVDAMEWQRLQDNAHRYEYHTQAWRFLVPFSSTRYKEYASYIERFMDHLESQVETDIIIDSSKYPLRALNLASIRPNLTCCIYVKRDPLKVIESFKKRGIEQPYKNPVATCLYLVVSNALCLFVSRRLSRRGVKVVEVIYDKFLDEPASSLEEMAGQLGLNLDDVIRAVDEGSGFETGPILDGNRIRRQERVFLEVPDTARERAGYRFTERLMYILNRFWWKPERHAVQDKPGG